MAPPGACEKFTAKMSLARATVVRSESLLDVLAPIAARASGNVGVEFFAADQRTLFTGYFPRRIRGEMRSFQVLGNR